ncbi:MAG: hydrogenase formation protein HypD [Candidatus Melainabacteria bacterium]|nr:hydrogenase formation protein HypD [Candidatus Melainabacteria bacterium]
MKYVDEYRDLELAGKLAKEIERLCTQRWTIMEVCGGQTHTILQFGIEDLLPANVNLVHGPGCPVCVTPVSLIDRAIAIASLPKVIFCSFGDMLRVPGSTVDLLEAKARGADVRIVYSPLDAVKLAKQNPQMDVVFFAVGFETTAPANAMSLHQAKKLNLTNYFVLSSQVLVPPVCASVLSSADNQVQAFIGPGHVCTITGLNEYKNLAQTYKVPIVVAGFEPIDILESILLCITQLESGRHEVINQYKRVVEAQGNLTAQKLLQEVFEVCDREWRGLGWIENSGLKLGSNYKDFDADLHFEKTSLVEISESAECISGQILRGTKKPTDCSAFGTRCTPDKPLGATMVSSEGTCANYFKFKRFELDSTTS